jgi:tetratricopeptide (TPR) repeat protein
MSEYGEAERLTRRALEIYHSLGDAEGEARLLVQRGWLQCEAGRYAEAEQTLQQARAIQERSYGADAAVLGQTWLRLAQVASYQGEHDEAQRRADRAWSIQRSALGDLSPETLSALALRGAIQGSRGRLDDAERTLRAVVEQRPQVAGYARHELLDDQLQLADVLLRKADTLAAEELYLEVLTLARRTPEELEARGRVRLRLAAVLSARGDYPGAERLLAELHRERSEAYPGGHRSIAESAMALAGVLARAGDLAGAEARYREAADIYRATLAHELPDLLRRRAEVAIVARRFPQAESFLDEALRNATTRQDSPGVSREIHAAYAALYTAWNRPEKAAEHRLRAQPPS